MSNGTTTDAGADYILDRIAQSLPTIISHFILANIPGVDSSTAPDVALPIPDAQYIVKNDVPVYSQAKVDDDAVTFSFMLDQNEGDYDFNFVGAITDTGVMLAFYYVPLVAKRAGKNQITTKNLIIPFKNAAATFDITIPTESWQIDFTQQIAEAEARLNISLESLSQNTDSEVLRLDSKIDQTSENTDSEVLRLDSKIDQTSENTDSEVLRIENKITNEISSIESKLSSSTTLNGPQIIYSGTVNIYKITNYDSFSQYHATINTGTVSISGDEVTLNIPLEISDGYLNLNIQRNNISSVFVIEARVSYVEVPVHLAPVNGASNLAYFDTITLFSSDFSTVPAGFDTHKNTSWQASTDLTFTNIVWQSLNDDVNLKEITIPAGTFSGGQRIYWRVKYNGFLDDSDWSGISYFDVRSLTAGDIVNGDIVAGQTDGDYLLVAPSTMREKRAWGLYATDTSLPNNTYPDLNTGKYNTDLLTSGTYNSITDAVGSAGSPAAEYARSNGYDLPNRQELELVYNNRANIDDADTSNGVTLASIATSSGDNRYVLTSSEYSASFSVAIFFHNGGVDSISKGFSTWVVPVRRIPV